jgi:hypothetical protein
MVEIGRRYKTVNCLNPANNGLIVTVTGFAGDKVGNITTMTGCRWFIDRELLTNFGNPINHLGSDQLSSIYDGNDKITWEDMTGLWKPKELTITT